jgi:hypothetical protein
MTKEDKPIKVEFAPGAFDNFEGTQEELDELLAEIEYMFVNKSRAEIEAMSRPLTEEDLEDMPAEAKAQLVRELSEEVPKRNLQ